MTNDTERGKTIVSDELPKHLQEFSYRFPVSIAAELMRLGPASRGHAVAAIFDLYFLGKMPDKPLPKEAQRVFDSFIGRVSKARSNSKQRPAKSYDELLSLERSKTLERMAYESQNDGAEDATS